MDYRKEIGALQAENYSLERQLFSYQKSIAYAHSSGNTTTVAPIPTARGAGGTEEEEPTAYDCTTNHRPFLDRSVSTDTEYA